MLLNLINLVELNKNSNNYNNDDLPIEVFLHSLKSKLFLKRLKYIYKKIDEGSHLLWSHENSLGVRKRRSMMNFDDNKLVWKNKDTTQTGYGEITCGSLTYLFNLFQNISKILEKQLPNSVSKELLKSYDMNKSSYFLDIGSGFGKPNFHASLQTGCYSKGIEVVPARAEFCMDFYYENFPNYGYTSDQHSFFKIIDENFIDKFSGEIENIVKNYQYNSLDEFDFLSLTKSNFKLDLDTHMYLAEKYKNNIESINTLNGENINFIKTNNNLKKKLNFSNKISNIKGSTECSSNERKNLDDNTRLKIKSYTRTIELNTKSMCNNYFSYICQNELYPYSIINKYHRNLMILTPDFYDNLKFSLKHNNNNNNKNLETINNVTCNNAIDNKSTNTQELFSIYVKNKFLINNFLYNKLLKKSINKLGSTNKATNISTISLDYNSMQYLISIPYMFSYNFYNSCINCIYNISDVSSSNLSYLNYYLNKISNYNSYNYIDNQSGYYIEDLKLNSIDYISINFEFNLKNNMHVMSNSILVDCDCIKYGNLFYYFKINIQSNEIIDYINNNLEKIIASKNCNSVLEQDLLFKTKGYNHNSLKHRTYFELIPYLDNLKLLDMIEFLNNNIYNDYSPYVNCDNLFNKSILPKHLRKKLLNFTDKRFKRSFDNDIKKEFNINNQTSNNSKSFEQEISEKERILSEEDFQNYLKYILHTLVYDYNTNWADSDRIFFEASDATKVKYYYYDNNLGEANTNNKKIHNHFTHIYAYNKLMSKECRIKIANVLNKTDFKVLAWYSNPIQTKKSGLKNFDFVCKFPMQSTSTEKFIVYIYVKRKW